MNIDLAGLPAQRQHFPEPKDQLLATFGVPIQEEPSSRFNQGPVRF